ncbi:MAG: CHAT domain-containing protein [Herpetosiphonaceae bacterium]|nr:CHAT domain-containing protein [Herpetosiphonaceae bacterium]
MTNAHAPSTGLLAKPTLPIAVTLQIARAKGLAAIVVPSSDNPSVNDRATLLSLDDLQAAPAGALLSTLAGTPVFIHQINPDNTCTFADQPLTPTLPGPQRNLPGEKDIQLAANEGDSPAPPRVVNAAIYYADDPPELVPATVSLALEQRYRLRVTIGARSAESRLPSDAPAIPEPPLDAQGLDLFVSVMTRGGALEFAAPTQVLHLPQQGDSAPLSFTFTPRQAAADVPIWVHVYYNWVLLTTVELHLAVTATEADLPAPLEARVSYTRSAGFADLEALRPNEVVLNMWADGEIYRMSVAWPGDGTSGRRDPARGLAVALPVNAQALANEIVAARNLLYDTTWQPSYRQGVRGKLAERRESLYQMAVAGNRLYSALFYPSGASAEQAGAVAALRQWLETVANAPAGAPRPAIQIIHDGMPTGLPWSLLYPDAVNEQGAVVAAKFWGCRYRLEVLTQQFAENAQQAPSRRETVKIVGGTYNFRVPSEGGTLEVTSDHRKTLTDWAAQNSRISIDLREQADQNSLGALLSDGDLVYMFCHGHTAKTPDDTSDWVARFRDQMAKLAPATREKYSDLVKLAQDGYQPTDPNIGDSWLMWNKSLLPLRLLSLWGLKLPRKPLVMLNMCESAQVLPTLSSGFIPFFSQLGARGVLGTECPMLAPFAAAFGQKLLARLLAGEKIGDILPALRLHFIEEERNPLGLAYTYYGDADVSF